MLTNFVQLTEPLKALAAKAATERHRKDRELNIGGAHHYGAVETVETTGTTAEAAFAKWLGVWPSPLEGERPDTGADYVINGWAIDVKGNQRQDGDLFLLVEKRHLADIYVLVIVSPKLCKLAGWSYAAEIKAAPVVSTGHNRSHILRQDQLRHMPELRQVLRARKANP